VANIIEILPLRLQRYCVTWNRR